MLRIEEANMAPDTTSALHDVEMEQPLFYGQWLIENGLNRGVG